MQRALIASIVLISAIASAQAYTDVDNGSSAALRSNTAPLAAVQQPHQAAKPARKPAAARSSSGVVTYDHDSPDPNVGWHWENGMRTCHQDCDNPEIPGSGYSCRNVQVLGMAMRECDWSSN